jgi:phosphoglycerate kinase
MIRFLDELKPSGKKIIMRTDLNSPFHKGKIKSSLRIKFYCKTIKELSEKGSALTLLSHQGKQPQDYLHLDQHAALLSKYLNKKVKYVQDITGEKAKSEIRKLKKGEILLLDNVRYLKDETKEKPPGGHKSSELVKELSPLFDAYVNDAFSAAHRNHASLTGFPYKLPSYAGRVMESELKAGEKALKQKGVVYIAGGLKCDDVFRVLEHNLKTGLIKKILTTGVMGNIFLKARGVDIGVQSEELIKKRKLWDLVKKAKILDKKYINKILVPKDIAYENKGRKEGKPGKALIQDIGSQTIKEYSTVLENAETIVFKGPAGVYEKPAFQKGTKSLLEAIRKAKGYSIIAGGDSTTALMDLKIPLKGYDHVSIAGGAFISFLAGEKLPAVEALKAENNL